MIWKHRTALSKLAISWVVIRLVRFSPQRLENVSLMISFISLAQTDDLLECGVVFLLGHPLSRKEALMVSTTKLARKK